MAGLACTLKAMRRTVRSGARPQELARQRLAAALAGIGAAHAQAEKFVWFQNPVPNRAEPAIYYCLYRLTKTPRGPIYLASRRFRSRGRGIRCRWGCRNGLRIILHGGRYPSHESIIYWVYRLTKTPRGPIYIASRRFRSRGRDIRCRWGCRNGLRNILHGRRCNPQPSIAMITVYGRGRFIYPTSTSVQRASQKLAPAGVSDWRRTGWRQRGLREGPARG